MNSLVVMALSNVVVAGLMAAAVLAISRVCRRPALIHGLWLLVLLKLITPPVFEVPLRVSWMSRTDGKPAPRPSGVSDAPTVQMQTAVADRADHSVPSEPSHPVLTANPAPVAKPVVDATPTIGKLKTLPDGEVGVALPDEDSWKQESAIMRIADVRKPAPAPAAVPAKAAPDDASASGQSPVAAAGVSRMLDAAGSATVPESPLRSQAAWDRGLPVLLGIWLAGSMFWMIVALLRVMYFRHLIRHSKPSPIYLQVQLRELATRLRMPHVPEARLLPGAISPMLWAGARKPLLLFPRELLGRMDDDSRSTLLLHELAHLRRGDHWVRYLELVATCLYWWNPIVWLARREIHRTEEECCDAFVVENTVGGGRLYATALLDTLDFLADVRPAIPPMASGIGHVAFIRHRLKRILAGSVSGSLSVRGRLAVAALAVALLPLLPTFAEPQAEKKQPKSDAAAKNQPSSGRNDESGNAKTKSRVLSPDIGTGEPTDFETTSTPLQFEPLEVRTLDVTKDGRWLASGHGRWTTEGRVRVWDLKAKKEVGAFPEPKGIASVAFSRDGTLLASAGWDRVLRIREMPSLKERHAIRLDSVARLAFSPDGGSIASATESQKLQFWDPKTGTAKKGLPGTYFRMQQVAYSADGRYLAVAGGKFENPRNGRVAVWDLKTGKQLPVVTNLTAPVISVAISPNGKTVIAGGFDMQVHAWNLPDMKPLLTLRGHTQYIESVQFSPDGKTIVSGSYDNTLRIWDAHSGEALASLAGHTNGALCTVFAKDGRTLYSGGIDKTIRLWDPSTYRQTETLQPGADATEIPEPVLSVAASSDGKYIASAHEDKTVRLRDAETGQVVRILRGHEDAVSHVAFSPDGKYLSTASFDRTVKLWKVSDGRELFALKGHTNWVFSAAFSPDGNLLATGGYDKTIRLWYVRTGKPVATLEGHEATVRSVAFAPNGERLVSGSGDRTLKIWDVKTRKALFTLKGHKGTVREVAYSPDGESIASASEDQSVIIWNAVDGKQVRTLTGHTGMVWALAFSPQGKSLASGGFDNAVIVWDPKSGARKLTLRGHTDVVSSLAFAAETRGLISGSYDRSLRLWKARQAPLGELLTISIAATGARAVEFSHDGWLLAAAAHDGIARVWDTRSGKLRHVLRGHASGIRCIAFSPDDRLLATGSWDHSIHIWDLSTGRSVARFAKTDDPHDVMSVKFTPDGSRLASGGRDGTVRLWNVASATLDKTFEKQELPITAVDITSDGRYLLAATGDYKRPQEPGRVLLWDLKTSKLLYNQLRSGGEVRSVRFSPDGRHFAVAGAQSGGVLTVHDTKTGKVAATPFQTGYAAKFAFLPDGSTLVANRGGKLIVAVNWRTGKELARFTGHTGSIYHITAAPDGSLFASASEDGTLKLWPTRRTPPLKSQLSIPVTNNEAARFAIPLSGGRLVTGGHDKLIKIWERKTGKLLKTLSGHKGGVTCGDISPDGRLLVTGSWDNTVRFWNLETMQATGTVLKQPAEPVKVRFSREGDRVVVAGRLKRIQVWDVKTAKVVAQTAEQDKPVVTFDISPDGKWIAGAVSDWKTPREPARIQLWTFPGLKDAGTLYRHRYELKSVRFNSDGSRVVIGGTDLLTVVDVRTKSPLRFLRTDTGVMGAAFLDRDRVIVSGDWLGRIRIWNAANGQLLSSGAEHQQFVFDMGVDRKSSQFLSSGMDGTVRLWELPRRNATLALRVRNWPAAHPVPAVSSLSTRRLIEQNEQILFGATSPDFRYFAAGSDNGEVTLYNAASMAVLSRMKGHTGRVWSGAFSPDATLLATAGEDKTVRLWRVPGGRLLATAEGHESRTMAVGFTPDGAQIVSVDGAGGIRLWDAKTLKSVAEFRKNQAGLETLAISPDGKLLAVAGWDKTVDIWRLADRRLLGSLTGHAERILSLAFSPDGKLLVSGDAARNKPDVVKVWDVETRTLKYSVADRLNLVLAIAWSPDGQTFVTSGGDNALRFWDRATGRPMYSVPSGHTSDVRSLVWSREGSRIISTELRGTARTWSVGASGNLWMTGYATASLTGGKVSLDRLVVRHKAPAWFATFSRDGNLLATGGEDKTARVWNTRTWEPVMPPVEHEGTVTFAAISPDGKTLASTAAGGIIHLTSLASGKRLRTLSGHTEFNRKLAFTPDGKRLLSGGRDKTVRIWDVATGKTLKTLDVGHNVWAISIAPDGRTAAVGTGDWTAKKEGGVSIWDLQTGERLKTLDLKGHITSLAHLAGGKLVVARGGVGVGVWDVETGKRRSVLHWPQDVRLVRVSRDGRYVAAAHGDGKKGLVSVYHLETGKLHHLVRVSDAYLFAAEFSADGTRIATAAKDGSVKLWRLVPSPD